MRTHPSSLVLSLFYQNKEGVSSLLGYLSIHILGLSLGTTVLPHSPNFFPKLQLALRQSPSNVQLPPTRNRHPLKTALHLLSYALLWWSFFGLSCFIQSDGVSRRMVLDLASSPTSSHSAHRLIYPTFYGSLLLMSLSSLSISSLPQTMYLLCWQPSTDTVLSFFSWYVLFLRENPAYGSGQWDDGSSEFGYGDDGGG